MSKTVPISRIPGLRDATRAEFAACLDETLAKMAKEKPKAKADTPAEVLAKLAFLHGTYPAPMIEVFIVEDQRDAVARAERAIEAMGLTSLRGVA